MSQLLSAIEKAETIAIGGHVRPDGDCIGSCMGLFRYIKKNYPDKQVCVYVEEIPDAFDYLKEEDAFYEKPSYDLFISLDCGDEEYESSKGSLESYCVSRYGRLSDRTKLLDLENAYNFIRW